MATRSSVRLGEATRPVTWGAAIDVPVNGPYPSPTSPRSASTTYATPTPPSSSKQKSHLRGTEGPWPADQAGIRVGRKRVARLMQAHRLVGAHSRKKGRRYRQLPEAVAVIRQPVRQS